MRNISQTGFTYRLLRRYALFGFRLFYREIIVRGKENIPTDDNAAIIFTPNHLNALMDALAVASITPKDRNVAFLARADLFAKKSIAKALYALKILPAFRMRDGMENLNKNRGSFQLCIDTLKEGQAVCIMPEGGQGEERKVRPLVKGVFRLAFDAQEELGTKKAVKIIPVGLHFEDLIKTGKELIINIGKPIEIADYMEQYRNNAPQTINLVRDELFSRLTKLTLHMPGSKHYQVFENCVNLMGEELEDLNSTGANVYWEKFLLKQESAARLIRLEQEDPAQLEELHRLSDRFVRLMKLLRFKLPVFSKQKNDAASFVRLLALIIASPIAIFGLITNLLPLFVPIWIRKLLQIEYSGFYSSVHLVLGLIFIPLIYLLQAIAFGLIFPVGIEMTLIFFALQHFTRMFSMRWYANLVRFIHKFRYNRKFTSKSKMVNPIYRLIATRNKIVKIISEA